MQDFELFLNRSLILLFEFVLKELDTIEVVGKDLAKIV
jgi:hypothetical protein